MEKISINGYLQSGNYDKILYLKNYKISLYKITIFESILVTETSSNNDGYFNITITENKNSLYYLVCESDNIKLMSIIGDELTENNFIIVNELTTIASLYCFNNFYKNYKIHGILKRLKIAYSMYLNFVNNYGILSDIIKSNPNGNETNALKLLNTLGNIISICIINKNIYNYLIEYTSTLLYKTTNTFDILISIIRNPSHNVKLIFETSFIHKPYKPYLSQDDKPDAFTLAIKFNDSGNINYLIGGPANIVFDKNDNAWISNNVIQGTPTSSNFTIVLQPNGKPTSFSPIIGGGVIGTGFGITKINNTIVSGNFGWGDMIPRGGLSIFNEEDGTPITNINTTIDDNLFRVQGMGVDTNNNLWVASFGNSNIVVYINGDYNNSRVYKLNNNSNPFDVATDNEGNAIISLSGNVSPFVPAGIIKLTLDNNNNIKTLFNINIGIKLLGIDVDSNNNIFVASSLNSKIYKISPFGNILLEITGDQINNPWSCKVDENDNVWISNFATNINNNNIKYGVSCYTNNGIPITPAITGYTLPSGGEQVLLQNGEPLSGKNSEPNYSPLMRQTSNSIDSAGNLWVCNNWKPYIPQDTSNPGGDGIVVFIGIANNIKGI